MERSFEVHLDMLQTSVRQLNMLSASIFVKNTKACVANALAQVEVTGRADQLAYEVVSMAPRIAEICASLPAKDANGEKQEMLDHISQLRAELHQCEPSQTARALGLE